MELSQIYRPLSADAFRCDESYAEIRPSAALAPYVHCFWGTRSVGVKPSGGGRVIPDTCMDLIFRINYTQNRIDSCFCALDDSPYLTQSAPGSDLCATFGIRFFAWSAVCFAEDSLRDTMGVRCDPNQFFAGICRALTPELFETMTLGERALKAERVLFAVLRPERQRPEVLNALYAMITARGILRMEDVSGAAAVSVRQLQRLFSELIGAAPKTVAQLIRFQQVYRQLLERRYVALDAVERYGYADQSHLIREFHRFYGLSPMEMVRRMIG